MRNKKVRIVSFQCLFKDKVLLILFISNRIEMTLSCAMALQNYPLDRQVCPVTIESCK